MPRRRDDIDAADNLYQVGTTWYLRVKIRGRRIRETLRTEDRREAEIRRDARLAELRGELHSWKEAVGRWLAGYLSGNVDASTARRYEVSIGQIARAVVTYDGSDIILEDMPIERITTKTIAEIVRWSKKHRPGITHATIRRDLTALSSALHATVDLGWREDNPAKTWDRSHIKERRDPIVLPDDREIDAVIAAAPATWGRAIRFLRLTGMRMEEGFHLQWSAIALDKKSATLTTTKANRARVVPFTEEARAILGATPRHIKSPYVFWHGDGAPYLNISSRHIAIRSKASVRAALGHTPRWRLHDLRHKFAVEYLLAGGSVYDLQQILGHASVKTTEIYLDYLDPETRQRAMRQARAQG